MKEWKVSLRAYFVYDLLKNFPQNNMKYRIWWNIFWKLNKFSSNFTAVSAHTVFAHKKAHWVKYSTLLEMFLFLFLFFCMTGNDHADETITECANANNRPTVPPEYCYDSNFDFCNALFPKEQQTYTDNLDVYVQFLFKIIFTVINFVSHPKFT